MKLEASADSEGTSFFPSCRADSELTARNAELQRWSGTGLGAVLADAVSSRGLQQVHESEVSFCCGFGANTRATAADSADRRDTQGDQATPSDLPRAVEQEIGKQTTTARARHHEEHYLPAKHARPAPPPKGPRPHPPRAAGPVVEREAREAVGRLPHHIILRRLR